MVVEGDYLIIHKKRHESDEIWSELQHWSWNHTNRHIVQKEGRNKH